MSYRIFDLIMSYFYVKNISGIFFGTLALAKNSSNRKCLPANREALFVLVGNFFL